MTEKQRLLYYLAEAVGVRYSESEINRYLNPEKIEELRKRKEELLDFIHCMEDIQPISFKLNEDQTKKYYEFCRKHRHPDVNKGAIGGHISIMFTPTGLGDGVSVKCNVCDKSINITDYDCW